ncbi:MAG: nucleotide exchange factor GrpE [Clostridia bacterium]|nr:nucleotide exchange factor GrpE [Clostridia bacterium]
MTEKKHVDADDIEKADNIVNAEEIVNADDTESKDSAEGAEAAEAGTANAVDPSETGAEHVDGAAGGHKEKDRKEKKKLTAELAGLEAKNAELEKKLAEEKDRYARILAEYDNYRKRTSRELDGRYADGKADAWKGLLPVIDNFERALAAAPEDSDDPLRKGIELTYRQFKEQMEKDGVKEIEALGKDFDPELHNAVMHCEDEALGENVIADVFMKGYMLGDKVLRHSMVKVAN